MDPTPINDAPQHFNVVDFGVFGLILLSGLIALFRGFVREVLSLAAWVGAVIATVYFYPILRPWMHTHIKSDFGADALTGLTLFCLALAILIPLGYLISGLVRGKALTAIDRSIGFVFGLARGVLVVCLLFFITLWIWPDQKKEPDILALARTRPFMMAGAEQLKSLLPKEDVDKMNKAMDEADKEMVEKPPSLELLTTPAIAGAKPMETTTSGNPNPATPPNAAMAVETTGTVDTNAGTPLPPTPPSIPPPPSKP